MKLHLKDLCREFGKAKDEETVPSKGVNPYLLENVLRPVLQGEAPMLGDIDYEQFDLEDIGVLSDYYDKMGAAAEKLGQFVSAVASLDPVPSRERQFC